MRKRTLITIAVLTLSCTFNSFAGQWAGDAKGRWYQEEDGSYPVSAWKEIDGKQYYFDQEGYLLTNTTTPDGYRVDENGVWIEDQQTADSDYYQSVVFYTMYFTDDSVIYRNSKDDAYMWRANLDGSNKTIFHMYGSVVEGVDHKIYYYDPVNKKFGRKSLDGATDEVLYTPTDELLTLWFADSTGIYLTYGTYQWKNDGSLEVKGGNAYYDIPSQQLLWDAEAKPSRDNLIRYDASNELKAAIPHNDYDSAIVQDEAGDYVKVITRDSFSGLQRGAYIINKKTNTCVAYKRGYEGGTDYEKLRVTDLGLMTGYNKRIEDGGAETVIFEADNTVLSGIQAFGVKGNRIYYVTIEDGLVVLSNLPSAPLPTAKVQ